MTISRTKTPDWAYSEVVTSAQLNALDANATNALDKRVGETDTLESDVTLTGSITVSGSGIISVDGGGELLVGSTGEMNVNGPLKVFGAASYVELAGSFTELRIQGAANAKVKNTSSLDIESGAALDLLSGSYTNLSGSLVAYSGASIALDTGSTFSRAGGSVLFPVDIEYAKLATTFATSSGSYVDITGLSVTLSCTAGDKLLIDATFVLFNPDTSPNARVVVVDGGGTVDPGELVSGNPPSTTRIFASKSFVYTVANTGSVVVKCQTNMNGASGSVFGDSSAVGSSSVRVIQYRS